MAQQDSGALARIEYSISQAGFSIPEQVGNNLKAVGFSDENVRNAIGMCLAANIPIINLTSVANLPVVKNAWDLMVNYGYRPGMEFYVYGFKEKDAEGNWTKTQKLALVRSIDCLMTRASEHARLHGFSFHLQTVEIIDRQKAEEMLRYARPVANEAVYKNPGIRVARSRVRIHGEQYGPDDDWHVGSFVPGLDDNAIKIGNANRQPIDVARTRAQRKALRDLCRTDYPLDNRKAEDRVALGLASAEARIQALLSTDAGRTRLLEGRAGTDDVVPDEIDLELDTIPGVVSLQDQTAPITVRRDDDMATAVANGAAVVDVTPQKQTQKQAVAAEKPLAQPKKAAPKAQTPPQTGQAADSPFGKPFFQDHPLLGQLPEAQQEVIGHLHEMVPVAYEIEKNPRKADLSQLRQWIGSLANVNTAMTGKDGVLLVDKAIALVFGVEDVAVQGVPYDVGTTLHRDLDAGSSDKWALDLTSAAYLAIDAIGKAVMLAEAEEESALAEELVPA